MSWIAIRMTVLAVLSAAMVATPIFTLAKAASTEPPPPDDKSTQDKKKPGGNSSENTKPSPPEGYRAAYAAVYDRNDYAGAIAVLKAIGQDDHADVANLLGYAYRKLSNYQTSQIWYERALRSDPNHVKTWQYYGLWQIEQGNRDQAQYHLGRIETLCGSSCEEYRSLAAALEKPPGASLAY